MEGRRREGRDVIMWVPCYRNTNHLDPFDVVCSFKGAMQKCLYQLRLALAQLLIM